jgi:large subunit ribosomal protein L25
MTTTLAAEARQTGSGKGAARKLRASGRVPAVVYAGGAAARSISVEPKALLDIFRHSQNRNTVVEISLGGESISALVKSVQRHPVSRELEHVDFYALSADSTVNVTVPLVATGKAVGTGAGGKVKLVRRSLEVTCPASQIPTTIELDVTPLDIGDVLRVSQVHAPEGVTIRYEADYPVANCSGKGDRKK